MDVKKEFEGLLKEISAIERIPVSKIEIDRIPGLADRCGCIAYVKGLDMPHLKEYLNEVYVKGNNPFSKFIPAALNALQSPEDVRSTFEVVDN